MRKRTSIIVDRARPLPLLIGDTAGNVLPLAAAGMLVMAALVGGGVDMSRAYMVKNRLQAACDAGVLAGRKSVSTNGFDTAAQTMADNYFNANFNEEQQDAVNTEFVPSSENEGVTVLGTATATVDTAVMKLFGKDTMDIEVACSASLGVGNSDVTMVLDTTGSMDSLLSGTSQKRIDALRAAMKSFYDTLATATAGGNTRIRYSFVPYSSSINVGKLISDLDPDYLRDSWPIQSRTPIFETIEHHDFVGWDTPVVTTSTPTYSTPSNSSWSNYSTTNFSSSSACQNNAPSWPADTAWANNGSASLRDTRTNTNGSGQQVVERDYRQDQRYTDYQCNQTSTNPVRWRRQMRTVSRYQYYTTTSTSDPIYNDYTTVEFDYWQYQQVTYDTSAYKTFVAVTTTNGTNGTNQTSAIWGGCIEERATVANATFSFSTLTGTISPSGATDLDIDSAPNTAIDSTKWAPMWPELSYRRLTSGGNATNSATSLYGSKTSASCPAEAQLLEEMDETSFDAYADSLVARGSTYHDLGIIWGARLSSPDGMWADLVNEEPDNGGDVARHMIFMTDGIMEPNNTIQMTYGVEYHDRRITTDGAVNAARHTSRFNAVCEAVKAKGIRVWVIAFGSSLTTSLTNCASSDSSFIAANSSQLNAAFQTIANQVGELRVVQ